jgi:hypothetical protein
MKLYGIALQDEEKSVVVLSVYPLKKSYRRPVQ